MSGLRLVRAFQNLTGAWKPDVIEGKPPTFIHVPKTGGTYLMQLESSQKPVLQGVKSFGHSYVIDQEGETNPTYRHHHPQLASSAVVPRSAADACFLFSTVRNIFSWLASYAAHAGGWNPKYNNPSHYDYAGANKSFDYLVKIIANRDDIWPCRRFIHCQFFSSGGDLMLDQINHQECLDHDLAVMAARLDIAYQRQAPERLGTLADYRQLYTDELIELVSTTWSRELALFGYGFDGLDPAKAMLAGEIHQSWKESVKYNYNQDELTVAGRKVPRR